MRCEDVRPTLAAYVLEQLTAEEAGALDQHVAGCAGCAQALDDERNFETRLRDALRVDVPSDLNAQVKAGLPAPARSWTPVLALAAAVLLAAGLWAGLRAPADVATPAGQHVVTAAGEVADLVVAGVRVELGPASEAVVTPAGLRLRFGSARCVTPAEPGFEVATPAGRVRATGGPARFLVETKSKMEVSEMQRKGFSKATAAAAAGAVAVMVVAVYSGAVAVENERGTAAGAADKPVGAAAGHAPEALADQAKVVARLERELGVARDQIADKEAAVARLEAKVRTLQKENAAKGGPPAPRAATDVLADVRELAKTEGLNAYGTVGRDTPIFKELEAMGREGQALLADLLKTGNDTEQFVAAMLMEKLRDPAAIPALEAALFGDDKGSILVQRMASHALGHIGGEAAIPGLERALKEGSEWGIKTNAAHSLAQMGRESGIEFILDAYKTGTDATVKMTMLQVMGSIGDASFVPELHRVLREETEYSKRVLAIMGISKASQPESLPILKALIEAGGADQTIATEAKKAYNEIAGKVVYPLDK